MSLADRLTTILSGHLDRKTTESLISALMASGKAPQVVELLEELKTSSTKLSAVAVETLPEFLRRCDPHTVVPWLDLAVGLAAASGATTLKYFRESPLILGVVDSPDRRQRILAAALELADAGSEVAPNCAFEFFRKAPELLIVDPETQLDEWGQIGLDLARWDFVLGIEFYRESPNIAEVLALEHVRSWVRFGMKLITENSLGKPDYVGTLEFIRASPALLGILPDQEMRAHVVNIGSTLADRSPETALLMMAEAPHLLNALPTDTWRTKVLQYGGLLADRDDQATLQYFRRCPEIVSLMQGSDCEQTPFEEWFRGGMEILELSQEGARAYFSLETAKALVSVEQAINGVPLRQVARLLQFYAQMICGESIRVESLPTPQTSQAGGLHDPASSNEAGGDLQATGVLTMRATLDPDNKILSVPALINQFPTREENLRWYTVMTAHEAGHLEFGTYRVDLRSLSELVREVRHRYGHADGEAVVTIRNLFDFYPQSGIIRDLWTILEDARIEYLLQQEYPGLREDFAALAKSAVKTRSLLHGMTAREMVLDALLVLFADETKAQSLQDDLQQVVDQVWTRAKTILHAGATAEEVFPLADELYQMLEALIGTGFVPAPDDSPSESEETPDLGAGPRAAEETAGGYRSITNLAYRGELDPDLVQGKSEGEDQQTSLQPGERNFHDVGGEVEAKKPSPEQQQSLLHESQNGLADQGEKGNREGETPLEQWLAVRGGSEGVFSAGGKSEGAYLYHEWDGMIQDYRTNWCRVLERPGPEGNPDFAQATLEAHGPPIRALRRYFETIRPTGLRRMHGYDQGDEVDLDAAVRFVVDCRVDGEPSDRIYTRRDKRDRQVAVAFLIDMSGSTGRQIESGNRQVIDVEKEGLVLLSEALEAIGDQYALYGYSGQGRHQVDFLVIKDFEETQGVRIGQRIDAVTPLHQNRDGAAIRHATFKLGTCQARHRLLILLSDGKPLDDGYGEEYALEDTKMALREARQHGITPFCLTIDREGSGYLKRMYGDVQYLVLDDLNQLPERLPRIYQRLTKST